ncbi:MAG: hypothetical protein ACI8TX_002055 [Hyphomicrobiaceae bacterium]|jgi:hypothetical protein
MTTLAPDSQNASRHVCQARIMPTLFGYLSGVTFMHRPANPDHPIHNLLANRHSPYAFDPDRVVTDEDFNSLFEAARWTMSSYNAQPWR